MITGSGGGFGELTSGGASQMRRAGQFNSGGQPMPGPMPVAPKPMSDTPSPGPVAPTPAQSPLGMWQNWLKTMGPYLAQMPTSEPNQESGGLSSLVPSAATPGTMRGFSGPDTPWQGNRGFRMLNLQ